MSLLHFFVSFSLSRHAKSSGRILPVLFGLLAVFGLSCGVFYNFERQPELSPVARGAQLAVASGCFACHGRSEGEERFNRRQFSPNDWKTKTIPTMWEDGVDRAEVIIDWITHGVPARDAEKHKQFLIQMPAYEKHLSPEEIDDIAAWVLAEGLRLTQGHGNAEKEAPSLAAADISKLTPDQLFVLGDRVSRQHGCYQCHGEFGQGGVANPASFKSTIPGFYGREFRQLTANGDRAEILHWIEHGRGHAIESGLMGKLAKKFTDGQAIGMPGYREHLSEIEKTLLTDYLLWLNRSGPLPAREVERIGHLLEDKAGKKAKADE